MGREKVLLMTFNVHDAASTGMDADQNTNASNADPRSTILAFLIKHSPLLNSVCSNFVEELSHVAAARIYMPGDLILEQGVKGDSMFVMISGSASVFAMDAKTEDTVMDADASQLPTKRFDKKNMSKVGS